MVRVGSHADEGDFVVADVPGLVEGAAEGKGLGHRFLRHVERARVLLLLLDLGPEAGHDPLTQETILLEELRRYRPELLDRPRLAIGSKSTSRPSPPLVPLSMRSRPVTRRAEVRGRPSFSILALRRGAGRAADRLAGLVSQARAGESAMGSPIVVHRPAGEGVEVVREPRRGASWSLAGPARVRSPCRT